MSGRMSGSPVRWVFPCLSITRKKTLKGKRYRKVPTGHGLAEQKAEPSPCTPAPPARVFAASILHLLSSIFERDSSASLVVRIVALSIPRLTSLHIALYIVPDDPIQKHSRMILSRRSTCHPRGSMWPRLGRPSRTRESSIGCFVSEPHVPVRLRASEKDREMERGFPTNHLRLVIASADRN
jgi:hypothetical protein